MTKAVWSFGLVQLAPWDICLSPSQAWVPCKSQPVPPGGQWTQVLAGVGWEVSRENVPAARALPTGQRAPQGPWAHLAALKLDVDQEGPVGDPQGAGPPAPGRGLQLQREAVLQPSLPAQLLPPRRRLLAELAHLGAKGIHFGVVQGVELMEAWEAGRLGQHEGQEVGGRCG